jgi:glucokinase
VDKDQGGEGIRQQLRSVLGELISEVSPVGIGVGFGGPVEWRTGRICRSHQIEGWSDFELGGWLQSMCGVPVSVDNDANVAALGEALKGAGKGCDPVFYVTLGSGVGGGLVVNGRIYHGTRPGESEIGHIRLDRSGTTLESHCSGWAVDAWIRELKTTEPDGLLSQWMKREPGAEARLLSRALEEQDATAQRILQGTAAELAFGLSHVTHLMHPEIIVLGGGLSLIGEPLRREVSRALEGYMMEAFRPGPRIVLAALGEDTVPAGALLLAGKKAADNGVLSGHDESA